MNRRDQPQNYSVPQYSTMETIAACSWFEMAKHSNVIRAHLLSRQAGGAAKLCRRRKEAWCGPPTE